MARLKYASDGLHRRREAHTHNTMRAILVCDTALHSDVKAADTQGSHLVQLPRWRTAWTATRLASPAAWVGERSRKSACAISKGNMPNSSSVKSTIRSRRRLGRVRSVGLRRDAPSMPKHCAATKNLSAVTGAERALSCLGGLRSSPRTGGGRAHPGHHREGRTRGRGRGRDARGAQHPGPATWR